MSFFLRRNTVRTSGPTIPADGSAAIQVQTRQKVLTYITLPNGKRKVRISRDALRRAHEHLQKVS